MRRLVRQPSTEQTINDMSATTIRDDGVRDASLNAVILYDDSAIAAKANAMLETAAIRADEATLWSVKPWRFDLLRVPAGAEAALKDANEAHLMVLAVRSQAALPGRVVNWLEAWAGRRQVADAALAVIDGEGGETVPATPEAELRHLARRHGLCFILGEASRAQTESAELWTDPHEREAAKTGTMAEILERASPDYRQQRSGEEHEKKGAEARWFGEPGAAAHDERRYEQQRY